MLRYCLTQDIDTPGVTAFVCSNESDYNKKSTKNGDVVHKREKKSFVLENIITIFNYFIAPLVSSIFFALVSIIYLSLPQPRSIQDNAVISLTFSYMITFSVIWLQRILLFIDVSSIVCRIIRKLIFLHKIRSLNSSLVLLTKFGAFQ